MKRKKSLERELQKIFRYVDIDGSGTLTEVEFVESCHEECIKAYFAGLGLDILRPEAFFKLIDQEGNGWVDMSTFVNACAHLKGTARSIESADIYDAIKETHADLMKLSVTPEHRSLLCNVSKRSVSFPEARSTSRCTMSSTVVGHTCDSQETNEAHFYRVEQRTLDEMRSLLEDESGISWEKIFE